MATIKDVAKLAGVSISTVSLVINNSSLVKMETKYKVEEAIKALNYTPNLFARSLVTKKKSVVGAVYLSRSKSTHWASFEVHADTFFTEMLPSIEKSLNINNHSLYFEHFTLGDIDNTMPKIIRDKKVEGVLLVGGIVNNDLYEEIKKEHLPVVLVGNRDDRFDYVDVDSVKGIYDATKYLIDIGHEEIAFINTTEISQSSDRKLEGYVKAMKEANLPIKGSFLCSCDFAGHSGFNTAKVMWESGARPTAIVTAYDGIAVGAIKYFKSIGVNCPEDISIIGYEKSIISEFSTPSLTTVNIHKSSLGREAINVLFDRMNKTNGKNIQLIISPDLEIGESTRPL